MSGKNLGVTKPFAFDSVEELQAAIDQYFAEETANEYPVTASGLAYALGVSRQTILNYQDEGHHFSEVVRKAMAFIEADKAKKMLKGTYNTASAIFDLCNNHKWINQKYVQETSERKHSVDPVSLEQAIENVRAKLLDSI